METKEIINSTMPTFQVFAVLEIGEYLHTEAFRLTLDECKEKFDSWSRNNHKVIKVSITFDGNEYYRVKDFNDLCFVVTHKDDKLFKYFKQYRL